MSLAELSRLSIENISRLATQKAGIPRISHSYSRLSDQEHEYLSLFHQLNQTLLELIQLPSGEPSGTEDVDQRPETRVALYQELLHSKALNDQLLENVISAVPMLDAVAKKSPGSTDQNPVLPLLFERDEQSRKIVDQAKRLAKLHEKLFQLHGRNRALHASNQQLVAQIDETAKQLSTNTVSSADEYQLQQIDKYKEQLEARRSRIAVLSEFLVALITATGVDWALSPSLQKLILECGDYTEYTEDAEDVWMT